MTNRDERLLQLEMDRAILYGESCMLEYDMRILQLQESGLLTESGIESLQYLLEAAVAENGFGGLISKVKNFFAEFLKRFKDKEERQKFDGNINKLNNMLSAGAITVDDAINLCMTPKEMEDLAKRVNQTIQQIKPKIENGTATAADVEILNKAIHDLDEIKSKGGVTLGEDQSETTEVAKEIAERGYKGIVGRCEGVSSNITNIMNDVNSSSQKFLSDYGVATTKTVKGGKIISNGVTAKNSGKVTEINRSGADIGSDLAKKVTGTGTAMSKAERDKANDELKKIKDEYSAAKEHYDNLSNEGRNTGSDVDKAKADMDRLKGEMDRLQKKIDNDGKSNTVKGEEEVERRIAAKSQNASAANINEYREAHKQFLRYLELYAMLEGKYALECDQALNALTKSERDAAIKKYTDDSLASIDNRIKDKEKELKKLTQGTDEYNALDKEIKDLKTHRSSVATKLTGNSVSTKKKLDVVRDKVNAAKARADESEEDLARSNDFINTSADNRAKRDASWVGRVQDTIKTKKQKLIDKFLGDKDERFLKNRTRYWKDRQGLPDAKARAKAEAELREKKEVEA